MSKPKRILVATDFSECAAKAFPYATALASQYDSELLLTTVVTARGEHDDVVRASPVFDSHAEHVERLARDRLEALELPNAASLRLRRCTINHGSAAPGLSAFADDNDVDLIALATHGRRPIAQLLLGSVARGVVSNAPCPVLCVRGNTFGLVDPASGKLRVERILVPTDVSEQSLPALRYAIDWARREGASVRVVHVVHVDVPPVYFAGGISSIFELDPDMCERARREVDAFVATVDTADVPVTVEIAEGAVAQRIATVATATETDVIVIGRRGHGDTLHLIGGACERLLHDTPCPMLVVHETDA